MPRATPAGAWGAGSVQGFGGRRGRGAMRRPALQAPRESPAARSSSRLARRRQLAGPCGITQHELVGGGASEGAALACEPRVPGDLKGRQIGGGQLGVVVQLHAGQAAQAGSNWRAAWRCVRVVRGSGASGGAWKRHTACGRNAMRGIGGPATRTWPEPGGLRLLQAPPRRRRSPFSQSAGPAVQVRG